MCSSHGIGKESQFNVEFLTYFLSQRDNIIEGNNPLLEAVESYQVEIRAKNIDKILNN